jgi:type I restriction enzyme, S subunit
MEVRPGYRRTEVGVIPEEWNVRPCSEVSERIMVGIVIRPTQYYVPYGVPAFRSANIRENGITDTDLVYISDLSNTLLAKSQTRTGDVLTVRTGYPGTSAVVRPVHAGCNCIDILITRPSKKVASDFLAIWINSSFGKEQVLRNQGGLAQKHFNVGDMRNLVVALPSLPEQRAIATTLRDVDGLLGGLDRHIAKKRDLKQAALQQLLSGQTRLPGFSRKWVVKRLQHAGRCLRGVSYRGDNDLSIHDTANTKRLLRANNVQNAIVVTDEVQFVNAARVSSHQVLRKHDILICMANGSKALVGKAGVFVANDGYEYTFGAFMGCFRTDITAANSSFVFHLFQTGRYRNYINNLLAGSSINNLRPSSIESLEFPFPEVPEQAAIAEVLTEMSAELAALEQRREKGRALKQAMMQELLTGRTRLVSPEEAHA